MVRTSILRLVAASSLAITALRAAWNDASLVEPIIQKFAGQEIGNRGPPWATAQERRSGQIYVGCSRGIVRFDGAKWSSVTDAVAATSLAFDPNGRLWFGGQDDIGYIDCPAGLPPRVVSLKAHLPFSPSALQFTSVCYPAPNGTYFIASDRVLHWDGATFKVWNYPGTVRLFPVIFEGGLWFHHLESGLYRLDADGPIRQHRPAELPDRGLFWLERRGGELIGASNLGFRTIEAVPRRVSDQQTSEWIGDHRLTGVYELTPDFRAVLTLNGGIGVIDRNYRIVRRIALVGDTQSAFLDDEGYLWVRNGPHLLRLHRANAVTKFSLERNPEGAMNWHVAPAGADAVWLNAGDSLLRATVQASGIVFDSLPGPPADFRNPRPVEGGTLVARFGGIDYFENLRLVTSFEFPGCSFAAVVPLRDSGRYLALHPGGWVLFTRKADGSWETSESRSPFLSLGSLAVDPENNLWIGSLRRSVRKFSWSGTTLAPAPIPKPLAVDACSAVAQRRHDTLVASGKNLFLLRPGSEPILLGTLPGSICNLALSLDERRVYAAFLRAHAPPAHEVGLAQLELSSTDTLVRQRDLLVPELSSLGAIASMVAIAERGTDTVWVAGAEGVIQIRPEEIAQWVKPRPPLIDPISPAVTGMPLAHDAQLQFRLISPEIALRSALRFQTRFGAPGGEGDWTEPSDDTAIKFSQLREGNYTLAARTVNPAGETSEPVTFSFAILPPWYRSPWAYCGYATVLVAAVIGAIRHRERRIRARNLELERLVAERTAELVKANAAKDDFLASMSHEIRNPMNGVVGLSAAIDITHLDEEGRYRFGLLRHCATHLASLLEDILDFSKLQAGTIELDPQPFSPAELLDAVSAITSPVSAAAGVKIEFALGPSVPARLIGDARRIRQVLLNYVSNAIKYAPQGDIEVTLWARNVEPNRAALTFAVSDAGPGVPTEEQERIFERFERGAGARSNRIPGTGMGLAVCRRLATKMGGKAWVESSPGEGATFYLSLELPIAPPVTRDSTTQTIGDLPKLALIVDDEDYNLVTLATMLERCGFQTLRAATGNDAVTALAQHPDVIFLDYDMPDTTGPALAKRIRETARPRPPLIIATTAYSTVEKRRECLAAGMDGFLSKPISEDRLGAALAEAIRARSPGNAHHFVLPSRDSFDPLENIQMLARQHAQSLKAELAEFSASAQAEFAELHAGLAAEDCARSTRAAHKLAGRFGFLHAAAAMKRALQLERTCQLGDWAAARQLATELTQDWNSLRDTLAHLKCESA